ncbi:MAG TPA: sigma 54-interacting transcriptional regulator [Vicinamibacteria bacterium]|nr:sigma 54-interacting transcriptional regulator [Vicinamibacteria bacterium]
MTGEPRPQPAKGPAPSLDAFVASDPPMARCLELARLAARTELPVLILGESGCGKTLLASAIHHSSRRAGAPFVSFNAAALSDTLLESQLFGHEKGAFTGADRRVKGKFELAHRGTLFLDEIADMSGAAQAKILRAVEYGEYERLGSESLEVADVRLVSATHHPRDRFMEGDQFRRDLFYRISGITITVPPLRARPQDLRVLIAHEIEMAGREQGKTLRGLAQAALQRLVSYAWPGNLRELKRVIQVAVALTEGDLIPPEAVILEPAAPADGGDPSLAAAERRHIERILEEAGGNKRKAARLLKISRSTLDRKLGA